MNRLTEAVERFERMIPAGGLSLSSTGSGTQIVDQRIPPFWAKITGVDGDKHSWQEVTQIEENVFEDVTEGRSGSADFAPAYEVNGGTVAEDTYVLLHAHRGGEYYLFSQTAASSFSLTVGGTPAGVVEDVDYILFDYQTGIGVQRGSVFITAATNDGQPIRITTLYPHRVGVGSNVVISGCTGNTAANGDWTVIEVVNSTTFVIGETGNGDYTGNGYAKTAGDADVLVFNEYAGFYQVGIIGTNTYEEEQYLGVGSKTIGGRLGLDAFHWAFTSHNNNRVFLEAVNEGQPNGSNSSYLNVTERRNQIAFGTDTRPAEVRCGSITFMYNHLYPDGEGDYIEEAGIGARVFAYERVDVDGNQSSLGLDLNGILTTNNVDDTLDYSYHLDSSSQNLIVPGDLRIFDRIVVGRNTPFVKVGITATIPAGSSIEVKGGVVVGFTPP